MNDEHEQGGPEPLHVRIDAPMQIMVGTFAEKVVLRVGFSAQMLEGRLSVEQTRALIGALETGIRIASRAEPAS